MDDEEMFAALAKMFAEKDPVPPKLVSFAKESHRLLELRTELAELTTHPEPIAAGVREGSASTTLQFSSPDVDISIRFDGEVALASCHPAEGIVAATLDVATGSTTLEIGSTGIIRFTVPEEPFRLRIERADSMISTDWITRRPS